MDRFRAALSSLDTILDKEKERAVAESKGKKIALDEDVADDLTKDGAVGNLGPSTRRVEFY